MPPLPADSIHARACKLKCEKILTRPERWIDMPRMSKKRKQEWALFLNDRNRIIYNELCRKCRNDCKQSFRCIVVLCPKCLSKRRTKKND